MNYGVGLFPTEPLQKMIHLAKVTEESGYSHIWVGDSHLIWREAYINMAAMALHTSKVKLGTGVTNPLTRHPSVVASGYATLEEYAPGRMIVGIGLGDSSVETMGMKPAKLSYFEKTLGEMRELLAGKEVQLETGKIHLLHPCKSKVPIYIAASGPKMLELSGRIADGIIVLVGVADEYIAHAKDKIAAGASA
jgi:5,10-methylenetetrahydromethanopterin reductase